MNFAWSLFTILSAVVYSFYALLFLRILYGLAQAGCSRFWKDRSRLVSGRASPEFQQLCS
ncbi:MAG: hypothetical protein R3C11_00910 [Planctomycetaceae bacterium]